jgi:hypothetical protein
MQIEHQGYFYAFAYDGLMGVGRFVRLADDALTLLDTGSDCAATRRDLNRLKSRTSAKGYKGPPFETLFDSWASEYTYEAD